jgi:hypothetical protein
MKQILGNPVYSKRTFWIQPRPFSSSFRLDRQQARGQKQGSTAEDWLLLLGLCFIYDSELEYRVPVVNHLKVCAAVVRVSVAVVSGCADC